MGAEFAELRIARSGLVDLDQAKLAQAVEASKDFAGWWADEDTIGVRITPGTSALTLPLSFRPKAPGKGTLPAVSLFVEGVLKGTIEPVAITLR